MDSVVEFVYYWVFAILIARGLQTGDTSMEFGTTRFSIGAMLFAVGEFGNFCCHRSLAQQKHLDARKDREKKTWLQGSDHSFPFEMWGMISCPHYTYEMLSWVGFNVVAPTAPGIVFTVLASTIMTCWAIQVNI